MEIRINNQTSFKRRLKPAEEKEFSETLQQGKKAVGNTGMSALIVPSSSLPQNIISNTGTGNILNKESLEFFEFAKKYWGVDVVQLLPEGNIKYYPNGIHVPYSGSTLDFGNQIINLKLLTEDDFGKIISEEDFKEVLKSNQSSVKDSVINYENVIQQQSQTENILKKGYKELLKADTDNKRELLKQFEEFELRNAESLERKSLFYALAEKYQNSDTRAWEALDHNLFDTYVVSDAQRAERIAKIKETHPFEIRFYKFKQFLAEKHLDIAKKELHKRGLALSGDMACGFSYSELWAYPKAFHKERSIGWGLPALNLDTPEGVEKLKEKVRHFAEKYDKIRVDAAWTYSSQPITNDALHVNELKNYGGKFIDIIEDEFKKVKGSAFKKEDLMYEFAADPVKYTPFENGILKPEVRDRIKIYCSDYLDDTWGTSKAYKEMGWKNGTYMLGVSNHDSEIYKVLADETRKNTQIETLAKLLKIPKEKLLNSKEFIKAKYAEIMRSEHNMFFFTDILNLGGKYQGNADAAHDFRIKIPENYQEHYFKSLEKGEGLNIMDALEKAFKAEGLDETQKDLYQKIKKYKKILQEPEGLAKNKVVAIVGLSIAAIAGIAAIIINKTKQHPNTL